MRSNEQSQSEEIRENGRCIDLVVFLECPISRRLSDEEFEFYRERRWFFLEEEVLTKHQAS